MEIAMVAGEASGDLLGGLLLQALQKHWPDLKTYGIGSDQMMRQGFEAWWPSEKLAVHGYAEALKHYWGLSRLRRELASRILMSNARAFIGIDAPDFNLGLEERLKTSGMKAIHFVSPSVWAWRKGRLQTIAKSVDHVLCLFPFEKKLYDEVGVAASYVGHPLADIVPLIPDPQGAKLSLGLDSSRPVLAVLPGSRSAEIRLITPRFLAAVSILVRKWPHLQVILPTLPVHYPEVSGLVQKMGLTEVVRVLEGQSHAALEACDVTLIASGTATLEAMLYKKPMVIGYVIAPLSWQIMKRLALQPWVGLPNILSEDFVVPELLQDDAQPQALASNVLHWLENPTHAQEVADRFDVLHRTLRCNTAQRATQAIASIIEAA